MGDSVLTFMFLILAATFLTLGQSLPTQGDYCPHSLVPPTNARGVNRLNRSSSAPLFRLEVVRSTTNSSQYGALAYKVTITAANEHFPYSEAKISVASKSLCDTGSLTFDHHHFFDARQVSPFCPRVLLTNRKLPMVHLPELVWRPPSCGCVQFRAVVLSVDNVHYTDRETVQNGPLSQNICVQKQASREVHLHALCHVRERYSAPEIISRPTFLQRHQLEVTRLDKHGLELGLELRRSDNRMCCGQVRPEARMTCFDDARRRRIDRFCQDGYPDIPFTSFRVMHMRDREKHCCFLLGEHRYSCFAEKSQLLPGPAVSSLDFSQDETDPVNDLPEFASSQDQDVLESLGTITFGEAEAEDDTQSDEAETDVDDELEDDDENQVEEETSLSRINSKESPAKSTSPKASKEAKRSHRYQAASRETSRNQQLTSAEKRDRQKEKNGGRGTSLSSMERRQLKSSREAGRRSSAETGRVTSSRETEGARASSERSRSKNPGSAERGQAAPRRNGYQGEYSRGGAQMSREREPLSSSERGTRTSGQNRQDWPDMVDEPDFEDQGGTSVGVTLDKLKKQMDRLQMRRQCCEAGTLAGRPIYGLISPVRRECEHSGHKYIRVVDLATGVRGCLDHFMKCCMEQATAGPAISSSEFRDNQFLYVNNLKKLGPIKNSHLERRDEDGLESDVESLPRGIPGSDTPNTYEQDAERRFQSMRVEDSNPRAATDEDDEYDGPRRFDETDNDSNEDFDLLDRGEAETSNTATIPDISQDVPKDVSSKLTDDDDDSKHTFFNETTNQVDGSRENKKQNKKPIRNHHLQGMTDLTDQTDTANGKSSKESRHVSKVLGGRSRPEKTKDPMSGGRSRQEKTEGRSRSAQFNSRERPAGQSSRTSSRERQSRGRSYNSQPRSHSHVPRGKIGTQDSQEMAAAHARKFVGTLDSKEMADEHKRNFDFERFVNDRPARKRLNNVRSA